MFRKQSKRTQRRGTATVEFAVSLPVLVLLVFGSVEAANAIYLRQAVTVAAYEAARSASETNGTNAGGAAKAEEVLAARHVQGATVNITPTLNSSTPTGEYVRATVTAPLGSNLISPQMVFGDRTISVTIVMVRQ